ncbi:MAG: tetratricopeptide repeat protein [Candidatus Aminicenantales bacterium]
MKTKRLIIGLAVAIIAAAPLWAQGYKGQGRIAGLVTDQDGKPLPGVKVKLFSLKGQSGFEMETDQDGEWKANYIRGGTWNLDFEKPGYMPKKLSAEIKEFDRNKPIELRMEKMEGLLITEELKAALNEGNALYEAQRYEDAIAAYKAIIEANPEVYVIYKNIGNCYFQLQKYGQAEEYYRKVLDKDPQNADALLLIGNSYANSGQDEKAMEWYNKIDFENITDQMVLFNIGSNFYKQSKFDQALKYYLKAVEIQPDFLDAIYHLGLTYLALNNYPEAIASFENYLKQDSSSDRADQVKGFIEFLKKK